MLHELRRKLRPVYGHYADAVISLIGNEPVPSVLNSAKRGDLSEAHANQIAAHRVDDPEREPFTGWYEHPAAVPVPSWFSKPLKPIPPKLPKLEVRVDLRHLPGSEPTESLVRFFGLLKDSKLLAGSASFRLHTIGGQQVMLVDFLEQHTKQVRTKLSRQLEGWKNAAMLHLEEIARKQGCSSVLFSTGKTHSESNNTAHPIHVELLETYGRLPMQHGYKLRIMQGSRASADLPFVPKTRELWWVKAIKKT